MPRSPSRDRSDRFTGSRGYVNEPDRLWRWKAFAMIAGVVVTLAWVVVEAAHPHPTSFHTHGELANPHATWDDNCAACHEPHSFDGIGSVLDAGKRWYKLTCTKCHAGPEHHSTVDTEGKEFHDKCSNCHHDHNGRTTSLTAISDSHCTRCHSDLAAHMGPRPNDARYTVNSESLHIHSFAKGHAEFSMLSSYQPEKDGAEGLEYPKRQLKFSHALHMFPGLQYANGGKEKLTYERMKVLFGEAAAAVYGGPNPKPDDEIQLNCQSCHKLDSGRTDQGPADESQKEFNRLAGILRDEPRSSLLPSRAAGAYYLPINYDAHCKACHPLQAPATTVGEKTVIPAFSIPHRKQPAELKSLLRAEYAARLTDPKNPTMTAVTGPGGRLDPRKVPGDFFSELDRLSKDATAILLKPGEAPKADVPPDFDPNRTATGGYLCGKCHFPAADPDRPADVRIASLPDLSVWFPHAMFNHVSHRGMDCASCHPGTDKPAEAPGRRGDRKEPVRIWGVDSCRVCHLPTGGEILHPNGKQKVKTAGVRHNCVDCHRYHNNDRPLQGLGAVARDPRTTQSLEDFLGGGKKK